MWNPANATRRNSLAKKAGGNGLVALAVDKDKASQLALKWAVDNLLTRGQTIVLIHVAHKSSISHSCNGTVCDVNGAMSAHKQQLERQAKDLFVSFHIYCTRKDIECLDIVLEDSNVAKALIDYVSRTAIENLVFGASKHSFIKRLKMNDIPGSVMKGAPDFCTVYIISKTKISSVRNASRPAPFISPLYNQILQFQDNGGGNCNSPEKRPGNSFVKGTPQRLSNALPESPFVRGRAPNGRMFGESFEVDNDLSFISASRPSTDHMSSVFCDSVEYGRTSRLSTSSSGSFDSMFGARGGDSSFINDFSSASIENDYVEDEMRRLKLELQKTMEMYSTACKEALTAKEKAEELNRWRLEEERRLEEARVAEETALAMAEREKAKSRAATEHAEAAHRIAELEVQKRTNTEMQILKESEENQQVMSSLSDYRYRRYTIEEIEEATEYFHESRKIGEGGYGPVFKCYLDHTPVAVKVLRPDASEGRSQFQKEVEVLSCMRHPNLVILLGACPEYGCLVYEYMANGSLEDCLFRKGNTPPLSWQQRFCIAAEIATGLLFLHQTKPEPLVHRDIKPGNILLDHNYVSKIGDVGLARIVPPSVAEDVTQYQMTSTAGTFCYIDPEYQQTGMLGVKSDVYSLGVMFLQLITGKPPMGLTFMVNCNIERGTFKSVLDPAVPDWPVEEALTFAKLSLQCAELRRKDRPDLGKVMLPELNRLRELAYESLDSMAFGGNTFPSSDN